MARLITKKSTVAAKVPLAADLEIGELAVNTADAKIYTKHSDGNVVGMKAEPLAHTHAVANTSGLQTALNGKQPLDADLTAIAALAGTTGLLKKTAANTWVLDTAAYTTNTGTVTSVGVSVPTGLSVTGSPVTASGTIAISYSAGYSIPTTAKQTNWDSAYGWGNHASAGYYASGGALGTPASGTLSNCTADGTNAVGFRNIPQNSKSAAYTLVLTDAGKCIFHPSADTTARIWTIPANSSVAYPIGTTITFINQNGAGVLTIAITADTMRLAGAGTTGSHTLAANGVATAIKIAATEWIISGFMEKALTWTWTAGDAERNWRAVASSSDGTKLVAAVFGDQIYTSADSGVSWTAGDAERNWRAVASSSDGTKLVAAVFGDQIYTSADSGVSWTARESARDWRAVASSSDGTKLVAAVFGDQIYTSADSGVSWTARESARDWYAVASSSDGTKLVAAVFGDQIYTSADSGVSWTARESNRDWASVASSSDGTKLVAAVAGGQIYTSTDSGVTWTARESARDWASVASSSDGTKLVAAAYGGQIYTSADSGVSWTAGDAERNWYAVASSSDGAKLVAAVYGGQIYTGAFE